MTLTGILTDYALMDEGEFTGYYGARIDDQPYVVLHHVDAFLLRLSKGERVEVALNKDRQISKIMRAKAPVSSDGTKIEEQIAKEQLDYNTKAKSCGFGEPTPGPANTEAQKVIDAENAAGDARKAENAAYVKELVNPPKKQEYIEIPPKQLPKDAAEREREAEQRVKDKISSPCMGCDPHSPDSDCQTCKSMTVKTAPPAIVPAVGKFNKKIDLIKAKIAPDCTDTEFELLMYMANTYGLDPLLKQIWAVKRNANTPALIFAGRDGMLAIAHRSGHFDGMQSGVIYEGTGKDKKPVSAWCEIWRNDMTHSFKTDVPFSEYNTGYSVWKTNPSAMILKVAEAVCLRKAFSVSGLYAPEEIDTEVRQ